MNEKWKDLQIGNVVRWNGSLYIVFKVREDASAIDLVPLNNYNVTAHPSLTWPEDETIRVDSIKFVAENVKKYITKCLTKVFEF